MKKPALFAAIAIVGTALVAGTVLADGRGSENCPKDGKGYMSHKGSMGMHGQAFSDLSEADRDAMHKEMGEVMKKWIPNFDADTFDKSHHGSKGWHHGDKDGKGQGNNQGKSQ